MGRFFEKKVGSADMPNVAHRNIKFHYSHPDGVIKAKTFPRGKLLAEFSKNCARPQTVTNPHKLKH